MRKQKPGWATTNTSWEIKKVVWHRWSLGDTDTHILRHLQLNKDKYPDIPVHRDTIRSIRNELLSMPVEVAQQLTKELPEIQSFVEEQRPDLKGKLVLPIASDATLHDNEIFNKSDTIINEEEIQAFLDTLELKTIYSGATLGKLTEFKELFQLEKNKYVDSELTGLCESLVRPFSKLIRFLSSFFKPDIGAVGSQDDTVFRFNPPNCRPRQSDECYAELLDLTESVRTAYSAYRAAVRRVLFL
ncbi:MAG: hypothetical protein PHV74_11655 [Dehalococcoidia bacterium]|nr:hypothetical protein [Dehalococcoidia bacterium]